MKIIFIFVISCLIQAIRNMSFQTEMKPKGMLCFGESLTENTLIVGEVLGGFGEFYVRVYDDVGNLLYSQTNSTKVLFSFTTLEFMVLQLCVDNMLQDQNINLDISIKAGIAAKDYSKLASRQHLDPIALEIKKMEENIKEINKESQFIVEREQQRYSKYDDVSFRLLNFSGLTIIFLIALSYIQTLYLKNFFKTKKLI